MAFQLLMFLLFPLPTMEQITENFAFSRNFSSLDMLVTGLAQTSRDGLMLTVGRNGGSRAFYRQQAQLLDPNVVNKSVSFNTSFVFQILGFSDNEGEVADGMVFVLAPASLVEANEEPRGGTCLAFTCDNYNTSNNLDKEEHLFGVEFDTFMNYLDLDGDHIGIDINSVNSSAIAQLHMNSSVGHNTSISLHKNLTLKAWIEYRGDLENIKVWLAENGSARPELPHINYNVSLQRVILPTMYVGFSASSGRQGSVQTIYEWAFAAETVAVVAPGPPPLITSSKSRKRKGKGLVFAVSAVVLITVTLLLGFMLLLIMKRRRRRRRKVQQRERQARDMLQLGNLVNYTYKELHAATRGFKDFIGKGGSCNVYKGVLPSTGSIVAVKLLTENAPSEQQFMAEVNVISQVRHHSLVALKGWCQEDEKLLLVYEYMSNGSLDKLLFSSSCAISWNQRYEIIRSVAEGLAYLHEGLEKRIIHRDVKAANVLLDENMNAKLGDFGLARFMGPRDAQTLTRAGTAGYISPELVYTGRATESSDVYSFGILVLVIVAGRRAMDFSLTTTTLAEGQSVLLDWVWKLHQNNELLGVVDPKVAAEAGEEAMIALQMGLLCCNLAPSERPTMRKCCQVFAGDAEVPPLTGLRPAVLTSVFEVYGATSPSPSAGSSSRPLLPENESSRSSITIPSTSHSWSLEPRD